MEQLSTNKIIPMGRNEDYKKYKYEPNFLGLEKLPANTIIFGGTGSGKSTVLLNLFMRKLIHEYEPEDVYIFSRTAKNLDPTYRPLFLWALDKDKSINVYDEPDLKVIEEVVKHQRAIA
jgi:type IV secretory pathway VirB4 component